MVNKGKNTGKKRVKKVELYQPDKYHVHVGKGDVGFCTVWNEPKAVLQLAPELEKKAALVGTLYSSYGVNIMLRNLALNPSIRRLYLWGYGSLSNTQFGVMGSGVLKKLWERGVNKEGAVVGTTYKLEAEIDRKIIDLMREKVELVDVSGKSLQAITKSMCQPEGEQYMESTSFPEAQVAEMDEWPSEQVGWLVRGQGVIDTWTRVVERIMRYGTVKGTQYGSQQKELIGLTWVIHDEDPKKPKIPKEWPTELKKLVGATKGAIEEYHKVFLSAGKPKGVSYTYGNRLMRYPVPGTKAGTLDQIKTSIIRNLKDSPDSRRAVATTLVPWVDAKSDEPPCITQVQCLQNGGKLHFLVTVRSHDIFKGAVPNAFGLRTLQAQIAHETGFEMGVLQITSQSAHIYESDWEQAKRLADCSFWKRPVQKVKGDMVDPRGVVIVRIEKGKIQVDFNALEGQTLIHFESKSADRLVLEMDKHRLMSQTGHALDIGVQLARAEIALKKELEFVQDRPLKW